MTAIEPRRARLEDLDAIAAVYRAARDEAMPWLPVLHTAQEERDWLVRHLEDPASEIWVVEVGGRVAGYAILHELFLLHLFVSPGHQRHGAGGALFTHAKARMPFGFRWCVFQRNQRARRFYEARGGVTIELRDEGGEEKLPDAVYEWRP
ncbi:MAG TPA: GNAT family N-acetyltransferase [Myxococcaceae bacterium]